LPESTDRKCWYTFAQINARLWSTFDRRYFPIGCPQLLGFGKEHQVSACVVVEQHGAVGLIRLNRPQVRNALNNALIVALAEPVDRFEADPSIGALVVTGGETVFAAGADIAEMAAIGGYEETFLADFNAGEWLRLSTCRKPVIAAVAGYALGGGCELALMCDFILAADGAQFGQLEVTVGITPGGGGTQRLARFIGKSKAMEMCLSGRLMGAEEAERCGLVSRLCSAAELIDEAVRTAARIAALSRAVTMSIKECVNQAYETGMASGLLFERRALHASFGLPGQREGMTAFLEKRPPHFNRDAERPTSALKRTNESVRVSRQTPKDVTLNAIRALGSLPGTRQDRAQAAARLIRLLGPYRWAGVYEVVQDEIAVIAWDGPEPPAYPRFPLSQGLNGAAVATKSPVIVQDVTKDSRYLPTIGGTRGEMIQPIVSSNGSVMGTIDVESAEVNAFSEKDEWLLSACADALQWL
jgi:enoyl-CoA hydratase